MNITTANMKQGSIWHAAGLLVTIKKQTCSPRCVAETPDCSAARKLIEDYEHHRILNIPQKNLMASYTEIMGRCKELQAGRIGGGCDD